MNRIPTCAAVVLTVLSMRGERLEARYVEGSELVHSQRDWTEMRFDEITLDGEVLPPEDSGLSEMSTRDERTIRYRDTVVAAVDGRATRVRRAFEELRKHSVYPVEEKDEVGALEGRSVLTSEGQEVAELEGDGAKIEETYLTDHALVRYADYLLPDDTVELGGRWQLDDSSLRRLTGIEGSPAYFASDVVEEDPLHEALEEGATMNGDVEFAEVVERDGMRCAVLAFEVELEAAIDDISALAGGEEMGNADATGEMRFALHYRGKLWYALAEGRPVAMEMQAEGPLDMRMETSILPGAAPSEFQLKGTTTMGFESTWTTPG